MSNPSPIRPRIYVRTDLWTASPWRMCSSCFSAVTSKNPAAPVRSPSISPPCILFNPHKSWIWTPSAFLSRDHPPPTRKAGSVCSGKFPGALREVALLSSPRFHPPFPSLSFVVWQIRPRTHDARASEGYFVLDVVYLHFSRIYSIQTYFYSNVPLGKANQCTMYS